MNCPDRLRLPMPFDLAGMVAETARIPSSAWVPHFNEAVYDGDWSGVALRSPGGVAEKIYPDPAPARAYADTELLGSCPALRAAVARFRCPMGSVRLLALGPGAVIKDHRDYRLAWKDGEVRIHVPICTRPGVEFFLDDIPVEMAAGEAWYLNLTRPHRAANHSSAMRVHLVLDCEIDEWLTQLVQEAVAGIPDAIW
jgi:hypothetical protein